MAAEKLGLDFASHQHAEEPTDLLEAPNAFTDTQGNRIAD